MEEIAQILANAVSESAKKEWTKAELTIKVLGASIDKFLEFQYSKNKHNVSEILSDRGKVSRPVYELHKTMNAESPKHWNKLLFTIDSDGKFDLSFEWDQKEQDHFEAHSK